MVNSAGEEHIIGQIETITGWACFARPFCFSRKGYCVEIGVFTGLFSEVLCRAGLKVYDIDPWLIYPEFYGSFGNQERQEGYFEKAKKRLAPYDCTIIRKTSMEAVKGFEDNSLDFVYIDGNHSFKGVVEDIWEWSKKVKKVGLFLATIIILIKINHFTWTLNL